MMRQFFVLCVFPAVIGKCSCFLCCLLCYFSTFLFLSGALLCTLSDNGDSCLAKFDGTSAECATTGGRTLRLFSNPFEVIFLSLACTSQWIVLHVVLANLVCIFYCFTPGPTHHYPPTHTPTPAPTLNPTPTPTSTHLPPYP